MHHSVNLDPNKSSSPSTTVYHFQPAFVLFIPVRLHVYIELLKKADQLVSPSFLRLTHKHPLTTHSQANWGCDASLKVCTCLSESLKIPTW